MARPLEILSLLSERRIDWYEAELFFSPKEPGERNKFHMAHIRREAWLGFDPEQEREVHYSDLLVTKKSLRDGLFQELVDNYAASPYRELISRVIAPLIVSRSRGYMEANIGFGYSVLETLISGLAKEINEVSPISGEAFAQLGDELRALMQTKVADEQSARQLSGRMLGELKRRPLADRWYNLLEKYDLGLRAMLWPDGADIKAELTEITKRRNAYIHQGKINDYGPYARDLWRIQRFADLCILKLLDCPVEAINTAALTHIGKTPIRHRQSN